MKALTCIQPPPHEMAIYDLTFYYLLLFLVFSNASATKFNKPRLSTLVQTILQDPEVVSETLSDDFQTFYYTQTLDHFNYKPESYITFQQRYVINFKYWGGSNSGAPIFAYMGEEAPLDDDLGHIGFLTDNAPRFNALQVYIEHRFYGKSIPAGSFEEAINNSSIRGYFNSAQALADYAEVLRYVKENLSAESSPIIVIGGSYGGMLASWFRLKYPHIALGALASSAPILYFEDITPQNGYYSIVTKDFKEASENCHETIKKSWSEIDRVASEADGLAFLSNKFKTCAKLNNSSELKDYLDSMYATAAQYNHPPNYPVTMVCRGIDGASEGNDTLSQIFSGVVGYKGNRSCYDTGTYNRPTETRFGWAWQRCSEMVMPIGRDNTTMFPPDLFDLETFIKECRSTYGVSPRPYWVTTYYGGHDIKLILRRFASNIIFSNGLRDPYSSGGVLEDISGTVLAIPTKNGSHCLDILPANETDPAWLIEQREKELKIIEGWIKEFHTDLSEMKQ